MKKSLALILAAIITAFSMTACGAAGAADKSFAAMDNAAAAEGGYYGWDDDVAWEESVEAESSFDSIDVPAEVPNTSSKSPSQSEIESTSRKIIKNGSLDIETLEYDRFIRELESSVIAVGGYIENFSEYGNSIYNSASYRSASYTVRVPAEKYDGFINTVGELGTVTNSNHSTEDVTLRYVDVEARLAALTAERDSFMELMEKAETVEDILRIQEYLTDVNYQIESYTSQLNTMKNQVSYSTVRINVSEVQRITPTEPKTVWERISTNLSENMYNISEGFKDFFVGVVSSAPYLVIYGFVILIIVFIVVVIVKASNRRQKKRAEEFARRNEQPRDPEPKQ